MCIVSLVVVMLSCINLALDKPSLDSESGLAKVTLGVLQAPNTIHPLQQRPSFNRKIMLYVSIEIQFISTSDPIYLAIFIVEMCIKVEKNIVKILRNQYESEKIGLYYCTFLFRKKAIQFSLFFFSIANRSSLLDLYFQNFLI